MWHLRLIGAVWLLCGLVGVCASLFDLVHNVAKDAFPSAITSDCLALVFCTAAVFTGYGIVQRRRWARVICVVVGVLLFLYASSCLLFVGLGFGVPWYALMWTSVGFAIFSLLAVLKWRC